MRHNPNFKVSIFIWLVVFFVLTGKPFTLFAQEDLKLSVTGGGVQFLITSLTLYENGITLENRTKVTIKIHDPINFDGWRLYIWSEFPQIQSDDGNDPLNLNYLRLKLIDITGGVTLSTIVDSFIITNNPNSIIIESNEVNGVEMSFGITYEFGIDTDLINIPWGFYYTHLNFKLESIDKP